MSNESVPMIVISNPRDVLADLHIYLEYVMAREVKRTARSNDIPRADLLRLAKLLKDDLSLGQINSDGYASYIEFLDRLALELNLVSYDLKGTYVGYTSSSPTFIDNYIIPNIKPLKTFSEAAPETQITRIVDILIANKSEEKYFRSGENEFFKTSLFGMLDRFSTWGSGVGVLPTINFPAVRRFLFDILTMYPPGEWIPTASLVAYLKEKHPWFLIPPPHLAKDSYGKLTPRYGNFYEGKDRWVSDKNPIPDDAPDGFERVEGRYVERFLEDIPLSMGFVDVAYAAEFKEGKNPICGGLLSFRVQERFLRWMDGKTPPAKVTVQPNFDVIIESDFYPSNLVAKIGALGKSVSDPVHNHGAYVGIFHLQKNTVAAAYAVDPDLDVVAYLTGIQGRSLPPNVAVELGEWSGHADNFVLYDGFGLVESQVSLAELGPHVVETISSTLTLVREPGAMVALLESNQLIPLWVEHADKEFALLPETALSIFPRRIQIEEKQLILPQVEVRGSVHIQYKIGDGDFFMTLVKILAERRFLFQAANDTQTILISQKNQQAFDELLTGLSGQYAVKLVMED